MQLLRTATTVLSALALGVGLQAQNNVFSIPDADASSGVCSAVPFGTDGMSFADQRAQFVIRNRDLPTNAASLGAIRFAPCGTGTRTFTNLRIRVAQIQAGSNLSFTFADNLAINPVTVLDDVNVSWSQMADTWHDMPLGGGYQYDGVNDLVIDIQVMGAAMTTGASGFHRSTSVERLVALFDNGNPPTTATVSDTFGLKVQLEFVDQVLINRIESTGCPGTSGLVPTLRFTGEARPSQRIIGGMQVLAFDLNYQVRNAPANGNAFLLFGASRAPMPIDLGSSCVVFLNPAEIVTATAITLDAMGVGELPADIEVPVSAVSSGSELLVQSVVLDPGINRFDLATTQVVSTQVLL